jgi:CBS domain-containing protein
MAQKVRDVMTTNPCEVSPDTPLVEAARLMREHAIGDVIVASGDSLRGMLTDRDIVVRAIAEGMDPASTTVDAVFSGDPVSVTPETPVDDAVRLMRQHAIRRLPVTEKGAVCGVVSLGDLAMERDERSALADISAAPANT